MLENAASSQLTPLMQQYLGIKKENPDSILFFRLGDFYEMFFEDAVIAAPVLEVQLTSRDKSSANPIPMCGIPYHAAGNYIQKLIQKGFKVAICEQTEVPVSGKAGKTIIKREVARVVTPSLVGDPDLVSESSSHLLLAIRELPEGSYEIAILDLLGGELRVGHVFSEESLWDWILRLSPKEFLVENLENHSWVCELKKRFPQTLITVRKDFFTEGALAAAKSYLRETQKNEKEAHFSEPLSLNANEGMRLDATALHSLEILKSHSASGEGASLLSVLDHCLTPMGRRTLKDWLSRPLVCAEEISKRHEAVEECVNDPALLDNLKSELSGIRDLERLTSKTALGLSMPRDLVAIREILKHLPRIKARLLGARSALFKTFGTELDSLSELTETLELCLQDEAPATLRDGGIFRDSSQPEIAELRGLSKDAKGTIASIELREREATGISNLKIKFSKVFGYTFEVTSAHLKKVPPHFHRKQTIANGERFVSEELKEFEEKVMTAETRLKSLEEQLFIELRSKVARESSALMRNAKKLGALDCILSFAKVSRERGYVRPELHSGWNLEVREGRHPVVETRVEPGKFVPNDIFFDEELCRTLIITGPNMAGKSTIMRQVALIAIMAQAGCFIPASQAQLPILDAVFTRIGSSDDLSRGQSTFMVEMSEVARVLEQATSQSLLVIDEIGRGTSTYDGLSLAWSLVEFIHTQLGAKTLFATHFHEITALEKKFPALRNASVLVEKLENEIVFLHRLEAGSCNRSYGIEVARLAGLPSQVLTRAGEILSELESQSSKGSSSKCEALSEGVENLTALKKTIGPKSSASIES
jgi:DNA mismatch repair protein MutS